MTTSPALSPTPSAAWFLSPCIEWIFKEEHADFCDRMRAAAKAGLPGIEFHMWRNKPLDEVKRAADETGLIITSCLVEPRCSLLTFDGREALITAVTESADAARRLGARAIVMASGLTIADVSRRQQIDAMIANLKMLAPIVAERGVTLLLEPVNTKVDHPGVFLDSNAEGLDVIEAVGHPSVRLLFDLYHSAAMQEDAAQVIGKRAALIGHVQAADLPGRNQPGSGGIDWRGSLGMLRERGYRGAIGLEYRPVGESLATIEQTRRAFGI